MRGVLMGPIALVALAHLIGSVDSCVLEKHENDSVILQFEFDPEIALKPLDITCEQNPPEPQHSREFFHQDKDKEDKKYQNRHFRDRVQTNRTALKDGMFQAQISGLLQGDSGLYSCTFYSSMGRSTSDCHLSVSAAPGPTEEPPEEPQRDTVTGSSKQTLWAALGIVPIIMAIMFLLFWFRSQIWDWFRCQVLDRFRCQVLDRFRCLVSGPGVVQVSYVEASTEPV